MPTCSYPPSPPVDPEFRTNLYQTRSEPVWLVRAKKWWYWYDSIVFPLMLVILYSLVLVYQWQWPRIVFWVLGALWVGTHVISVLLPRIKRYRYRRRQRQP